MRTGACVVEGQYLRCDRDDCGSAARIVRSSPGSSMGNRVPCTGSLGPAGFAGNSPRGSHSGALARLRARLCAAPARARRSCQRARGCARRRSFGECGSAVGVQPSRPSHPKRVGLHRRTRAVARRPDGHELSTIRPKECILSGGWSLAWAGLWPLGALGLCVLRFAANNNLTANS